jgi:hypothetical protein
LALDSLCQTQRCAHNLDPLRDGSEKDEGFPHRARETKLARYKRLQLVVVGWNAERKALGFFGHVTGQVSGWRDKQSDLKCTESTDKSYPKYHATLLHIAQHPNIVQTRFSR